MALGNVVKEATGKRVLDITKEDMDRGFRMTVHFEDEDGDGYRLDTYLSPYVENAPWSRKDLTNDVVEEAVQNILDKAEEDHPEMTPTKVEINELTRVRTVNIS